MQSVKPGFPFVSFFSLIAGVGFALPAQNEAGIEAGVTGGATNPVPGLHAPRPERMDDPPASVAAMERRTSSAAAVVTFGTHTSVQVNVDSFGNNIVGDAANEPSIAIDPTNPNRIAIGWRQFDSVESNFRQAGVAYSTNAGQSWTFSGVLDPGRFRSDPVLAHDGFGNFYYSSLTYSQANPDLFEVHVFKSFNGGMTWPQAVYAWGGDKQWLIADDRASGVGAGHLYQSWNPVNSCCGFVDFTRSADQGATFQSPLALPDPRMMWGTLDTDSNGVLYLVGSSLDLRGHLVVRSQNARNSATMPIFDPPVYFDLGGFTGGFGGSAGPNPGGLLGQVWVAAHPAKPDHVYVLGSVVRFTDPTDVMFARSVDGGQTWSAPLRVNDDPEFNGAWQWFGTLSVAPNGRIDAVWNDTRNTGDATQSAVSYSYSMDEGQTWSVNEQVSPTFNSHAGFPQQDKIGDYYHMISDNGGANLAYAATFNGEQDVYFLRIQQDYNANGIDDDCDTACGAPATRCDVAGCGRSGDCNGNRVPDECEPDADCDRNGQRDICEIGAFPALDCNASRTIDFCEDNRDCNGNKRYDVCDLFAHGDCNRNGIPDDCDVVGHTSSDRNGDGVPDECQGSCCDCVGCRDLSADECYFVNGVFGAGTLCGDAGACQRPIFAYDQCALARELPSAPRFTTAFDNRCAAWDSPVEVPCPSNQPLGADLWYTYTAPCTGVVEFSTCDATGYDAMMAIYGSGNSCSCPTSNAGLLACGDDTCGFAGGPPVVDLQVIAGRCYTIRLGGWAGSTGAGELAVSYLGLCNPTDLNGDTVTDLADFALFQNCFGPVRTGCESADFNHDGVINLDDYRAFHAMFGQ